MKSKTNITLFLLVVTSTNLLAQDTLQNYKNTVFLELGGRGGLYSINYDRILISKQKFKFTTTTGIALYPFLIKEYGVTISPNFMLGKKNHYFESGIGTTIIYGHYGNNDEFGIVNPRHYEFRYYYSGLIGYRYQKHFGGLMFRIGYFPVFDGISVEKSEIKWDVIKIKVAFLNSTTIKFANWIGIGFGYTF